ncbi:hypothetical protein DBV15_12072 [Temnothorax longispinosus]|uniref:THAP-type domain-containing protein n=1 Tax=Temnothorax longispinosus TaxID=300112 RepID=A0A4S2KHN3_9HYME|nr:hypothetical protein DBV15_12072 [Temnothorax longispinosus]
MVYGTVRTRVSSERRKAAMVGCCAKHCKNRSENGFRMFRFPKDKQRKQVWLEKCGKSIAPTSRLCERHFDDSQFENHREDKWRKLKPNAVPTIFNDENSTITFNNQLAVGQQTPHENLFENDYVQDFNPVILTNFNSNIRDNENVIDGNSLNEHFPSAKMVTDTSIQTDGDNDTLMLQTKYISNEEGTIRQANEIKYLQLQLEKERAKANMLKSKYENEKLLRLKMTTKMKSYKKKCCTLSEKLEKIPFFKKFAAGLSNPHQLTWSLECLKLAIQIRYAVGWKAYLYLKKDLQLPLPAYSTLCKHISKLDFSPGLLKDVLSLMAKKKKTHSSTHQSDSVVLMDEMDIKKSLEYDVSTVISLSLYTVHKFIGVTHWFEIQRSFIGQTTCEERAKLNTTVVVFMLRGLTENWKQIISWHLTSKSSDDCVMTQLLLEIVEEIEKIGFRVHGLICDMGPKNQAIWRNLGVNVSRDNVVPFINHPVRTDVPHLLKNLRMALTNNFIIIIARSIVESENLPCNEVRFKYLEELVAIQERHSDLKLAPNITAEILRPSSFNKMQVPPAAHIFNVRTAVALETLIELKMIDKEAETTAWFIRKRNSVISTSDYPEDSDQGNNEEIGRINEEMAKLSKRRRELKASKSGRTSQSATAPLEQDTSSARLRNRDKPKDN